MITNQMFNRIKETSDKSLGLFNRGISHQNISFKNYLVDAIHKVNDLEQNANEYSIKLASGELDNIHEAMIASQKAEIASQFMIEIRNKVLDAYKEIMRMQI